MCESDRVGFEREEGELHIKPWHATAGRQRHMLGGLGHAVQARSQAAQLKEKAERPVGRLVLQARVTWS